MAQVEVTREALQRTKVSLQNFQMNMEEIPTKMVAHIHQVYGKCEEIIGALQKEIDALTTEIEQLKAYIAGLQEELNRVLRELGERQERVVELERKKEEIYSKIFRLEQRIKALQAGNDVEGRNDYEIAMLERECRQLYGELTECKEKINDERYQIEILKGRRDSLKQEISRCENTLRELEKERRRKQDKMCRLKASYGCVQNTCNQLKVMVESFQYKTLDSTSGNIAGIDQCISVLDEYMSV